MIQHYPYADKQYTHYNDMYVYHYYVYTVCILQQYTHNNDYVIYVLVHARHTIITCMISNISIGVKFNGPIKLALWTKQTRSHAHRNILRRGRLVVGTVGSPLFAPLTCWLTCGSPGSDGWDETGSGGAAPSFLKFRPTTPAPVFTRASFIHMHAASQGSQRRSKQLRK